MHKSNAKNKSSDTRKAKLKLIKDKMSGKSKHLNHNIAIWSIKDPTASEIQHFKDAVLLSPQLGWKCSKRC